MFPQENFERGHVCGDDHTLIEGSALGLCRVPKTYYLMCNVNLNYVSKQVIFCGK